MKPRLFIFGSYITAMVMETGRLPGAGETLVGRGFRQTHGGKGGNMAVQAARLGADVTFAGVIGRDPSGDAFLATLGDEGIAPHGIRRSETAPTGTGFIVVDSGGRNFIVIDSGANLEFTPANDFKRLIPLLSGNGAALAQCEIPLATALAEGRDEPATLRFACAAASLSTTRIDTIPSYHTRAEVDLLL